MIDRPHDYTDRLVFTISLPRCRTAWLAEFFKSFMVTWHDPLKNCESIDELHRKIDRALFANSYRASQLLICDTAICFFMKEIVERFPGAKFVVIERPVHEVNASLRKKGMFSLPEVHATMRAFREWIHILPGARTYMVMFDTIDQQMSLLAPFITGRSLLSVFGSEGQFKTYCRQWQHRNVQIPFAIQNRQTDWGKVRKLMAGKFSFENHTLLRGG